MSTSYGRRRLGSKRTRRASTPLRRSISTFVQPMLPMFTGQWTTRSCGTAASVSTPFVTLEHRDAKGLDVEQAQPVLRRGRTDASGDALAPPLARKQTDAHHPKRNRGRGGTAPLPRPRVPDKKGQTRRVCPLTQRRPSACSTNRPVCTMLGFGSSSASTASTYGG